MPTLELEEVTELEDLFHDDILCSVGEHEGCTIKAVARLSFCGGEGFWCATRLAEYRAIYVFGICTYCKRPTKDCWQITPI